MARNSCAEESGNRACSTWGNNGVPRLEARGLQEGAYGARQEAFRGWAIGTLAGTIKPLSRFHSLRLTGV